MDQPRIVVTLADPGASADPAVAELKNRRYLEALERAGGDPGAARRAGVDGRAGSAFAAMDGLLLSGGADIDPARYGEAPAGAREAEPGRDALEDEAFRRRSTPACRFSASAAACRRSTSSRRLAGPAPRRPREHGLPDPCGDAASARSAMGAAGRDPRRLEDLEVNSYHHQAMTADRLAPALIARPRRPRRDELVKASSRPIPIAG